MHDNGCLVVCSQQSVDCFLILYATSAVIDHYLGFHPCRLDILPEMIYDVFTNLVDAVICSEEGFNAGSTN